MSLPLLFIDWFTVCRTDICMVVVQENSVLSSVSASKLLNDVSKVQSILEDYGAVDPGVSRIVTMVT